MNEDLINNGCSFVLVGDLNSARSHAENKKILSVSGNIQMQIIRQIDFVVIHETP